MIEGAFTLPEDIVLEPVDALPEDVLAGLAGLDHRPGDFALTRPRSRMRTHIVNDSTARLLRIFREPVTIADAVIRFSRAEKADPASILDQSFPVLKTLIEAGMLLPSDNESASRIDFLLGCGDRVGDLIVDQPAAIVIDTEVYLARTTDERWAALKIARPGSEARLAVALDHEAEMLALLDGSCSPRLLARGDHAGRPFIAMEWCHGIDAFAAATLARGRDPHGRELATLLLAVVEAYVRLHDRKVVHGDVHPRNLIVCGSARAAIIDFGQAHRIGGRSAGGGGPGRGLVDLYMEPELARTRLAGAEAGRPTFAGEQYSIAALLYLLLTGSHTHDFVLEKEEMLRQLVDDPPRAFAEHGIAGFGQVERVFARALEKDPEARFASLRDFQADLREAMSADGADAPARACRDGGGGRPGRDALLDDLIERTSLGGRLIAEGLERPSASVNLGSAGLAFAMLRIARQREDESLLAVADIWSRSALADVESSGAAALTAPDLEMSAEMVGDVSFYHARPGLLCVAALVADAQEDAGRRNDAVRRFAAAAAADEARSELVFGLSGPLLGCSILLDAVGPDPCEERNLLLSLGNGLSGRLVDRLGDLSAGDAPEAGSLGVAHGRAGIFYSLLQWAKVSATDVPTALRPRLDRLAALARPAGRGLAWPVSERRTAPDGMRATWCNGAAGHLHLWLLAGELLDDPRYLALAEGAAWTSYETESTAGDLCCGSAGRAYALLRWFRHCGDPIWLDRARQLADHAARAIRTQRLRRDSLYRGETGVCLLASDLLDPEQAGMPLFEIC